MVRDAQRDEFKWRTLYQQEPPSDEGSWVSADEVQITDDPLPPLTYRLCSDLALSVNGGDYSVHLVVGVSNDKSIYIVDAWRSRCAPDKTVEKHLQLAQQYVPVESLIDDDNAAKVYVQLLASRARETGIVVPWRTLPMRGQNKETRAAALRGWFKRKKVFMVRGEWNKWLVTELLSFPNAMGSGVDDGVDALSLIGRRLASISGPMLEVVETPKMKTIQDATLNEMWEDRELRYGTRARL
jgi:predicted phage terminase large subunit-like protein